MDMTLGQLSAVAGAIVTIWGAIALLYRPIKNFTSSIEKWCKNIEKRIEEEEERGRDRDALIEDSMEQREIFMTVILGLLEGMAKDGANGTVKSARNDLLEYMKKHTFKK